MKIIWLGHSCFRIESGSSVILIDPFLKGNPTFEASGIPWATAVDGVTHVALTHGHDDHMGDAGEICKSKDVPLFANYELALHVAGKSGADKLQPMNTGGTVADTDFSLTLTQAHHSSSSAGVPLGNPNGIVLRLKEGRIIYHMGDTDVFGDMALVNELYRPDVGMVPIGDRFTMGARTAAFACQRFFQFKAVFPCHYGTFPGMLDATAEAFVAAMKGHAVHVPKVGETVTL